MNAWPRKDIVDKFEFASLKPHAVRAAFQLRKQSGLSRLECSAKFECEREAKQYFRELVGNFGLPYRLETFVGPPNREYVSILFSTRDTENSDIIFSELVLKEGLVGGIWNLTASWRFRCGGKLLDHRVKWVFGGTDELGLALEMFQKLESRLGTPQRVRLLGFGEWQ